MNKITTMNIFSRLNTFKVLHLLLHVLSHTEATIFFFWKLIVH